MKILVVAATELEISPFLNSLQASGNKKSFFEYELNGHSIFPLTTGIGSTKTAFALATYPSIKNIDLAINIGLAGSYNRDLKLGGVFEVFKDKMIDLGAEDPEGKIISMYDLELEDANVFPFTYGWLVNDKSKFATNLPKVSANSVNTVSGCLSTVEKRSGTADLETMEGFGFAYACKCLDIQFLQIRGLSNFVEPRNKANWAIHEAVENSNQALLNLILNL